MMTFYSISKKQSGRYGKHEVHLQKQPLEWGGNDLIEIQMKITLNAAWCKDPHVHLAKFHLMQETAMAAPLIVGGKPMGPGMSLFVITALSEEHTHWLRNGTLIRATLDVNFTEYLPFLPAAGLIPTIPGLAGIA